MATKKKRPPYLRLKLEERALSIEYGQFQETLVTFERRTEREKTIRSTEKSVRLFNMAADFLDLLLEPDAAESAIGNLAELYLTRFAANPRHARRWIIAQVLWITYGRAMDVFGRFTRARA